MQMSERIEKLLPIIAQAMLEKKWQVFIAESCSGGRLAAALTALPGSSEWFYGGLVTYRNEAKMELLNVSKHLLEKEGAVSQKCALAMVKGLTNHHHFRLAITGFAGPLGERVGEVYIAWQAPGESIAVERFHFLGSRQDIMTQVVYQSLRQMFISTCHPLPVPSNVFFSLCLDDEFLQEKCLQYGIDLGLSYLEMEPMNHLHVTIAYWKNQSLSEIQGLKQVAEAIQKPNRFDLELTSCQHWSRANCLVLQAEVIPENLQRLIQSLPEAPSGQELIPHVTIAKRFSKKVQAGHAIDIRLPIKSFALMLSFHGIFYLEYGRWNLNRGDNNEQQIS